MTQERCGSNLDCGFGYFSTDDACEQPDKLPVFEEAASSMPPKRRTEIRAFRGPGAIHIGQMQVPYYRRLSEHFRLIIMGST